MKNKIDFNEETVRFFRRWVRKTDEQLNHSLSSYKVHQTGALKKGMHSKIIETGDVLLAEIYFKLYGRFVDMGKGLIAESTESNRHLILSSKKRKPKPWYSKTFFGRLSNLRGAIGYKMTEETMKIIKETLD